MAAVRERRGSLVFVAITGVVAALSGLVFAGQPSAQAKASPPACSSATVVQTRSGPVCGLTADGRTSYLDIPYAAPPIGRLRWHSPEPPAPWTSTYAATQTAPQCPSPSFPGVPPLANASEDCLYLEVQKPANVSAGANLPVMFEIHGGGFLGEAVTDDGSNFIRTGPVIYVYIRYRLGILGFLASRSLGAHSGDYGLQDQQAALRWVRDNIARFGGNAHNVTIFGESAGGASVCDQVASPTAKGLFERGISVSGFYNYNVNTIWWPADCKSKLLGEDQAQKLGESYAAKVGCASAAGQADCLRSVPVSRLLEAGGQFVNPFTGGVIGPIVNGTTLPMSAGQAFRRGAVNRVKLMIGVGRDEFNGGVYTNVVKPVIATSPEQYRQLVRQQFGARASTVMALYPLAHFPTPAPFIAYRTIMADAFSVCPALSSDASLSRFIPVYAYEDDDSGSPVAGGSPVPLGAYHSGINHLVHDLPGTLDADQAALQSQTLLEWTGFARTGSPDVAGAPPWEAYRAAGGPVMSLQAGGDSLTVPTSQIAAAHHCGFWDAVNRTAPWAP